MLEIDFVQQIQAQRYRVRPGFFFAFPQPYELQVRLKNRSASIVRVYGGPGCEWIQSFFGRMNGAHTVGELLEQVPKLRQKQVLQLLLSLRRKYLVLVEVEKQDMEESCLPNWWLNPLHLRQTDISWYEQALCEARVVVIGTGMIGSRVATGLVQMGLREIALIDRRKVQCEDRIVSPAYVYAKQGEARANSLAHFLNQMQEKVIVHAYEVEKYEREQMEPILQTADLILIVEDEFSPDLYEMVNRIALIHDRRWSLLVTDGWDIYMGPSFFPKQTGCYYCFETIRIGEMAEEEQLSYVNYVEAVKHRQVQAPLLVNPTFADIAAGMFTSDVPNIIGLMPQRIEPETSLTIGRQLHLDMWSYDAYWQTLYRLPTCPVCGVQQIGEEEVG